MPDASLRRSLDLGTLHPYIMEMARAWILALALPLAAVSVSANAQGRVGVGVDQVSKGQRPQDRLRVPPVRAANSRAGTAPSEVAPGPAPPQITRQMYEACRAAQFGGAPPPDVDCAAVFRAVAEAPRPTPEGTLLRMLGQRSNVTAPTQQRVNRTSNADVVAQQVQEGVDGTQGDAAAIAARQRGGGGAAPPPSSPR